MTPSTQHHRQHTLAQHAPPASTNTDKQPAMKRAMAVSGQKDARSIHPPQRNRTICNVVRSRNVQAYNITPARLTRQHRRSPQPRQHTAAYDSRYAGSGKSLPSDMVFRSGAPRKMLPVCRGAEVVCMPHAVV
ncbi:hypothetical protein AVEN_128716-1 [Araneus ventricosus]|uniref:Uncharacterized protein n=1 Tax=Araneus ventricosus TaxID=182803 RepID=A0A4Y2QX02_ARAVE|nr:hypothetical protein AVEN_128716-1 [Araneus ventricosus]